MSTALATQPVSPDTLADCEQRVLQLALTNSDNIRAINLKPNDYTDGINGRIWQAILDMHIAGENVNPLTVAAKLKSEKYRSRILEIEANWASEAHLDDYVEMICNESLRRKAARMISQAYHDIEHGKPIDEVRGQITAVFNDIDNPTMDVDVNPQWPESLPNEAYIGILGEITKFIEPATEADPAGILSQLLVAFGNVIGRNAYFIVESDHHYSNEYVCIVGDTSTGKKGTSFSHIRRIFKDASLDWFDNRVVSGLSSGEGLIHEVRDPLEKYDTKSGATEIIDKGINDKRLLVIEGEYASILKVMDRVGNRVSTVMRDAWDTGDLRTMTKNTPQKATGAHISIIAHITQSELKKTLSETDCLNGFGNRFLWMAVKRQRFLPEGGQLNELQYARFIERLQIAIEFTKNHNSEVPFDCEARELWHSVYPTLTRAREGIAGAMLARSAPHVRRLALIYALSDMSAVVESRHLLAALALWKYVEQSVTYIFGETTGNAVADRILEALEVNPQGLSRNEIRDLFHGHKRRDTINHALDYLQINNIAAMEKRVTDGRPIEQWRIAR